MAVIRWVERKVRVDKNRTRCHILCDHCHKTWHIRDMWQGGDNVSRRSLGKWLQNKIWTLFSTKWRVVTLLWNWVTKASRVSLCHNSQQDSSLSGIAWRRPVPECWSRNGPGPGDHGVLATYSVPSLDVSPSRAKWCNFNLIFNGAVSLRFLKTKLLFHSHIAFTEDNYSPSAILASLIVMYQESSGEARLELKLTG